MCRITILLLVILFIASINHCDAQAPIIEWQKCFGGYGADYASSVQITSDHGYIMAGYTYGPDGGDVMGYHGNQDVGDIWIAKTDINGNIQWQKCLGGKSFETGASIFQTNDGGYIVAGTSASADCSINGNHGHTADFWVVKLTSDGEISWQKMYGGNQNDYAYGFDLTSDGGYVVSGFTESNDGDVTVNHGGRDFWVIKIDATGNLKWQKSLGGSGDDESYSVKATPDGGCIAAGYTESNDGDVTGYHGKRDYWVVKIDGTGNLQWQKCLGGSAGDGAWSVQLGNDGGYIVAGFSASNDGDVSGNHGDADFWVVKLDNNGSIQWQKCYGGSFNETAYFIQPTPDGGYAIAGQAESPDGQLICNAGLTDEWIVKIDIAGNLQWQKSLGGNYYDEAFCVRPVDDGSYIVAGTTCSPNVQGYHAVTGTNVCGDFWLVKLAAPALIPHKPIIELDPALAFICAGTTATLTASAVFVGTNPTYQWTRNGKVVGTNSASYTASDFAQDDGITCTVINGGECGVATDQASVSVIVKLKTSTISPQITISASQTVLCPCDEIIFKASVTNPGTSPVYQWKVNGMNAGNETNTFASSLLQDGDVITCTYGDNTDCVTNGSVVSNSIKVTGASGVSPSISIAASTTSTCAGAPLTFVATPQNAGANPTYQWKINGINAGNNNDSFTTSSLMNGDVVSCTINSDPALACVNGGTASSNSIAISIVPKANPLVNIVASNSTACAGALVTFTATPTNAGTNPAYQWNVNGTNVGANSNIFSTSSLSNGDVVSCMVSVDPSFTCSLTPSAVSNNIAMTITNAVLPSIAIISSENDVCSGTPVTFTATAQNAGTLPIYQWKLNNADAGSNNPSYVNSNLSNGDQVSCVITAGNGSCSNSPVTSNIISMIINSLPVINITPDDTVINAGSQIQLNASISGNVRSFQWNPAGSLEDPSSLTPTTIPLSNTTTYFLTAISDKGCTASQSAIIKIFTGLYMPGAFTPNKDGKNDFYRIPPMVSLVELDNFSIYDRWGEKIFSTKNINDGWDGMIHGQPAPADVYVYIVKGINQKGKLFAKGTFVLIR